MQLLRIVLIAVMMLGAVGRASAADSTSDWGENDVGLGEAVNRGIALRRAGNDEAALAVFLDVEKRDPNSVRVLLHISTAALAVGKWLMAYNYLQKAGNHKDDPYYQRHLLAIENVARSVGERVGQFRARGSPAGAEVRLNGAMIGTLPMNSSAPLETGSYILEVSRPGYFTLRRSITIGPNGTTQEDVELSPGSTVALSTGPEPGGAPAQSPPGDGEKPQSGLRARWITWTLAGAAVVAATTSGVAFAVRQSKANDWNDNSTNAPCLAANAPQMTRGQVCSNTRRDIDLAQGVGIGAGVAAAGLAGAAVIHWVLTRGGGHPGDATASESRTPVCSPSLSGIVCAGVF